MDEKEMNIESNPDTASEINEADQLKGEVEFLKGELEASKNKFLRLYADFENYKKRMVGELDSANRNGKFDAVRSLLGAVDDLERALGFASVKPEDLIPGVKTVLENFARNLKALGVEAVPGVGEDFNPHYHEAIGAVDGEEGKIMHVYQQGFKQGEMLIRPARVVVGNGVKQQATGETSN